MKDKVLKTEITSHVEAIAKALRAYGGEGQPLCCDLFISTRRKDNAYDQYEVCVFAPETAYSDFVMNHSAKIYYADDDFGCECVLKTETTGDEEDE